MSVIPLTVFFSLLLAGFFVVLFAREHHRRPFASPERDSLLPLADEVPLVKAPARPGHGRASTPQTAQTLVRVDHRSCACRGGHRAPCADCQRRLDEQEPAYF